MSEHGTDPSERDAALAWAEGLQDHVDRADLWLRVLYGLQVFIFLMTALVAIQFLFEPPQRIMGLWPFAVVAGSTLVTFQLRQDIRSRRNRDENSALLVVEFYREVGTPRTLERGRLSRFNILAS